MCTDTDCIFMSVYYIYLFVLVQFIDIVSVYYNTSKTASML